MTITKTYYYLKPFIPRKLQLFLRRVLISKKRAYYQNIWPIDEKAGRKPRHWRGWPDQKEFALVLTHDVDTAKGQSKCQKLMQIEMELGFRSAFNFVPERYRVLPELRYSLKNNGFEVGVHGLKHDGKLYKSEVTFKQRAPLINKYLNEWKAVGFRSPAMHHNLEWLHELDIEYDASTFDTDPFEPQSDGAVFPFKVNNKINQSSYIELPYTLPQDHLLFIINKETNVNTWKHKLEWIVGHGGMALLNVHPDYMNFENKKCSIEEYQAGFYEDFLRYIKNKYADQYWHVLPKEMARHWSNFAMGYQENKSRPISIESRCFHYS
jgi:hypothetical protein